MTRCRDGLQVSLKAKPLGLGPCMDSKQWLPGAKAGSRIIVMQFPSMWNSSLKLRRNGRFSAFLIDLMLEVESPVVFGEVGICLQFGNLRGWEFQCC